MNGIRERLANLSRDRLALLVLELTERLEAQAQPYTPIAVVGMACRFPGHVIDAASYWKLLHECTDAIREVPKDRWDVDAIYDPNPEAVGKTYCRDGGFLDAVDMFDAEFFGLSPREAISMDPQQRLLLEVAWEALEDSGLAADRLAGSNTGVFIGAGANDYSRLLSDPASVDGYGLTGNALNALAGRISFVLGLRGPSLVVDTACSSSLVAVHLAAMSLRSGESRVALAGGVNLMLVSHPTVITSRLRMLALDGRCKAFDAAADGFVRSEGCGVVVLKRLEDAKQDGDRIFAVLRGSAVNQDGASSGFTVPNIQAQKALIQDSLRLAGLTAEQVHYVEAHGTGTSLGDPIEMQALQEVLGNGSEHPLFVGSVKSNIGHLESAAGIAGFMKAVLALKHREIPGQVHFHQPTPLFDWKRSRLRVTPHSIPWPDPGRGVACVSSFGVSGTNAHVVLEEADLPATRTARPEPDVYLLAISAKSTNALRTLAANYAEQAGRRTFADFCYTVNVGRAHLRIRAAVVGTQSVIQAQLAKLASGESHQPDIPRLREPRVAFLFSGEEIPKPGVGKELDDAMPAFREALDRCDEAARPYLDRSLREFLFDDTAAAGDHRPPLQLVSFALQYALAELWQSWGIRPASVCGFGVGEVVAARVAGCLSLKDAVTLILKPAQAITVMPPVLGLMSSVTGTWVTTALDATHWSRQPKEPARLDAAIEQLRQDHHVFIEMETSSDGSYRFAQLKRAGCFHLLSALKDRNELRSMLDVLSQAFVAGCNARFEALQPAASHRKISVPFYPFERRRYWLEQPAVSPQQSFSARNLFYGLEWRRQDVANQNSGERTAAKMFLADEASDCARFLDFVQKAVRDPARIALVTRGAWQVEEGDIAVPAHAALWGMARVLMSEHPDLNVTLVDLSASATGEEAEEVLQHELTRSSVHEQVAYRQGVRYVARLRHLSLPENPPPLRLNAHSTYLVTGGKGGVGRRLVEWLAEHGAGRIVILTRRPPSAECQREYDELTSRGHTIEIELADVSLGDDVTRAVERCGPNLKGIFHLAGVLDDGVLAQQTSSRFERVMAPKALGAWNLHRQSLEHELDFFVLFSSASGLLGTPGQANYAAANAFLDSLAQMRRGMGLCAHSIQWGPWAGTGMSESNPQHFAAVDLLDPRTALAALEYVLQVQMAAPQMVLAADWAALRNRPSMHLPVLADLLPSVPGERTLVAVVRGLRGSAARDSLRREVTLAAARVLRRDSPIAGNDGFFDVGMDSLMALELRNMLQSRLGVETTLPTSLLFDYPNSNQLADYLAETLGVAAPTRTQPSAPAVPSRNEGPMAIVGMGCRFPGGIVSPETYWDALCRGIVAITEIPRDRWDIDAFYDPDPEAPGKMVSRYGGFLDDIDQFDAGFFGIAPREAIHMDPQQRLLLEVAWETMENVGIATDRLADKSVGVFVGISSNDYLHRLESAVRRGDAYLGVGNALSASAGRLSYVMGWNGPSMAIDTACSSSLVAVHLACQALRDQRCRMALAGGVNAVLSPESNVQLSKAHMLSPDGLCKTFDSAADGYVRGEGCGLIALKRLDDALADGDRIWAVIRGSAVNQDGRAAGLTVPSGPAQVAVIQEALADAGLEPADVHYVEAHGTGTSLGDPIELNALAAAYAGQRPREGDLLVGSVKANLGHLESAAGIAGLMKAVLVLCYDAVPPQPHFRQPTPHIDWEQARLRVPVVRLPLAAGASVRRAAVSSFGFIGTNAHVVIEQAPAALPEPVEASPYPFQVLTLSARTSPALEILRQRYLATISADVSLEDICLTANVGRARFSHRLALIAAHSEDARRQLGDGHELLRGTIDPETPVRLALWFPEHSVTLQELTSHWLWSSSAFQNAWRRGAAVEATESDPRLLGFLLSYALAEMWRSWGIEPSVVAGQGLGEIAALCFAGALSAADGLERARSMIAGHPAESGGHRKPLQEVRVLSLQSTDSPIEALAAAGCRLVASMGTQSDLQMLAVWRANDAFPLFHALAELFVAGVSVDWARVYDQNGGRKISAPTYPFQRQRFWPAEAKPQAAPAMAASLQGHPLLGQRLHSPALTEIVFQSHISAEFPALVKDHQVYKKPILSGPTQLSMLMDSAHKVFPEGTYVISDVTFLKPNILSGAEDRTMQVILKRSGDLASFRVTSVTRGREEYEAEWIVHSTGTVRYEEADGRRVELDNLRRRYEGESHMPADVLYDGLQQVGVTLGPAYRWIDEMRYVLGSSLAKMRGGTREDSVYRIHPGLIDSCFQTMAGATGFDEAFAEHGDASVPALVSELRMFDSCERASWCHASLQFDHGHSGMTVGDWRLFDADGKVLVEAKGVYLQRAPRESLFRAVTNRAVAAPAPERSFVDWSPETIEARVQQHVVGVLGLKISETPGPREKLFDLGLDSLMAMDLKERLEADFGRLLPATLLWDYPTTGALTQYLSSVLVVATVSILEDTPEPPPVTDIAQIQGMSEEELDDVVRRELESLLSRRE